MLFRDPKRELVANAICTGQRYQVWIRHVAEMKEWILKWRLGDSKLEVRQERRESSKELLLSGRKVMILRIRRSPRVEVKYATRASICKMTVR